MLRRTIFLFCVFFIYSNISSQNLKETIELTKTNNNVINIYQNENTGEIFRHYTTKMDHALLEMDMVSELLTKNIKEGIIWEEGKTIQFAKGEHFLATNNDYILTVTEIRDDEKKEIYNEVRKYLIIQRSLLESEERLIIPEDYDITLLENGNFIISNYSENYGTEFKIYSDNMELLESYNPFLLGFSNIQFAEKNNILIALIYPTKTDRSNKMKMLFINPKSGKLQHEKEVFNNFSTNEIFAVKDLFIAHGAGWLNVFNTDGTRKWDRPFDEPVSIVEGIQGEYLYILTIKDIFCLLKKNGKIIWSEKISKYYEINIGKQLESVVNIDVIPLGIYSLFDGTEIGIIIGQVKNTTGMSNLKHQIILFRLNKNGELLGQIDLAAKSEFIKLISGNGKFKVFTDNYVKTYSK